MGRDAGAATGWKLWKGNDLVGIVAVREDGRLCLVGARAMAKLLGIPFRTSKETLILEGSGATLELVRNAAAGRLDGRIMPLASPVLLDDEDWWIESRAAVRLMGYVLGLEGSGRSLRWAGVQDVEHSPPPKLSAEEEVDRNAADASGRDVSPSAEIDRRLSEMAREMERRDEQEAIPSEAGSTGEVCRLRWGRQDGFSRAVFDLRSGLEPKVFCKPGKTVVIFKGAAPRDVGNMGSGDGIRCSVAHFADHVNFTFTHASSVNVRHFALTGPDRYVLDFLLSGDSDEVKRPVRAPGADDLPEPPVEALTVVRKGAPLVVVDPGHGGKDPGAVANGLREKDLNLQISKRLKEHLQGAGCKVRLTREDDRYLKLSQRTALANRWGADVFVSVHINALPAGRHARGVEIYLMALPSDKDAMQLALIENKDIETGDGHGSAVSDKRTRVLLRILGDMQQNAKINESTGLAESMFGKGRSGGLPMRRVAQAPFYVLRGAGMPSVLLELGFITERSEARKLRTADYQDKLARYLAQGIVQYIQQNS